MVVGGQLGIRQEILPAVLVRGVCGKLGVLAVGALMVYRMDLLAKYFSAGRTGKGFFPGVGSLVGSKSILIGEAFTTFSAQVRLDFCVGLLVLRQCGHATKTLPALCAWKCSLCVMKGFVPWIRPFSRMNLQVFTEFQIVFKHFARVSV